MAKVGATFDISRYSPHRAYFVLVFKRAVFNERMTSADLRLEVLDCAYNLEVALLFLDAHVPFEALNNSEH